MTTTLIRNVDWAIVWDEPGRRHAYRRGIDIAIAGDSLVHVGPGFAGPADTVVDGAGCMAMPGLIDIHSHPQVEPAYRGIREEHGVPNMYMTGLFERSGAFGATDDDFRAACFELAACELLKSGVTTLCDISAPWPGWADLFARSGLRGFLAPGFASARWKIENDHVLGFDWDEVRGRRGFEAALALIDALPSHPCGRLSGVISPMQIENCSAELLRDSFAAAQERKVPFTLHVAQSVNEFQEMVRRHGKTSIQWAAELGILAPGTILGHAIFPDTHSWIRWWTRRDIALIAESGSAVAHCPTPFARYGQVLESFGAYLRAGIVMGIGTDTTPHNMIEEIRKAMVLSRIASRDINDVSTAILFHAATVGGATALMRDDLGRLAPGMKADLVLVDLTNPWMAPARDPLRSLIFHAADRAVRDVYVAGRQVVGNGRVLTFDHAEAAARVAAAQARMMALAPSRDYRRRSADEIAPLSLPLG